MWVARFDEFCIGDAEVALSWGDVEESHFLERFGILHLEHHLTASAAEAMAV